MDGQSAFGYRIWKKLLTHLDMIAHILERRPDR